MAQHSLIMKIMASSITVANRAGGIIRDVMSKGDLGIIEKVNCFLFWVILIILIKVIVIGQR